MKTTMMTGSILPARDSTQLAEVSWTWESFPTALKHCDDDDDDDDATCLRTERPVTVEHSTPRAHSQRGTLEHRLVTFARARGAFAQPEEASRVNSVRSSLCRPLLSGFAENQRWRRWWWCRHCCLSDVNSRRGLTVAMQIRRNSANLGVFLELVAAKKCDYRVGVLWVTSSIVFTPEGNRT